MYAEAIRTSRFIALEHHRSGLSTSEATVSVWCKLWMCGIVTGISIGVRYKWSNRGGIRGTNP